VTGHLFQARFSAVAMDEGRLMTAARYAALNPVRARLVERAANGRWSSGVAHRAGRDDDLVSVEPLLDRCARRFADLIETEPSAEALPALPPKRSALARLRSRSLTVSPLSRAAIRVPNGAARSRELGVR
jgi:hypothetical protein